MIKKIASGVLLASALLLTAQPASALDLSKLQVKISDTINKDCNQPDGFDPIWGCNPNATTIYIRAGMPSQLLPYVLLQNVGQYVIASYSDDELRQIFKPTPQYLQTYDIRRITANAFAFWVLGGPTTSRQRDFFRAALLK